MSSVTEQEGMSSGMLDLSAAFGIQSIPTLMIFREEIILFSEAGMMSAKQLGELLGRVRSLDMQDVRRRIAEAAKAESSKKAVPQRTALNEA